MLSSLQSGLTGLQSHQTYLDVIGNNLANSNTTGYKSSRVTFTDLFSNTLRTASQASSGLGGRNPAQVGTGVRVGSIDLKMGQGAVLSTDRPFDLGIEGEGFFIVNDGTQNYYTRNGAFGVDGNDFLVDLSTGMRVQSAVLDDIQIDSNHTIPPTATTTVSLSGTLPANITGPLQEVMTSNVALEEGTPAELTGSVPASGYSLADGDEMTIRVNSGASQTVTFNAADFADITDATPAEVAAVINANVTGVTADVVGGALHLYTENTGEAASIDIDDGTGSPAAAMGLSLSMVSGTQDEADANTPLNDLVSNKGDYVNGDEITVTGTDADGLAIQADFIYGTHGTTLGELRQFITDQFPNATCEIDENGNLVLTADSAGEANLSLFIHDDDAATGNTLWPNFSTTTDGADADTVTTSMSVFDAMGVSHTVLVTFERHHDDTLGTSANAWNVTAEVQGGEGTVTQNMIKRIQFNDDGSFGAIVGDGTSNVGNSLTIAFDNIATEQEIAFDFGTQSQYDGVTQVGDSGFVQVASDDGYAAGTLATMSVEPNGQILGQYTNGQFEVLGEIGLAVFNNPGGLEKAGDSIYTLSSNSGSPILGTPNTGSTGSILTGALEQSNVDISEEFVALIEAQRGFQANARIISTSDEILTEMVNLVR